jgi:hypothetical protein
VQQKNVELQQEREKQLTQVERAATLSAALQAEVDKSKALDESLVALSSELQAEQAEHQRIQERVLAAEEAGRAGGEEAQASLGALQATLLYQQGLCSEADAGNAALREELAHATSELEQTRVDLAEAARALEASRGGGVAAAERAAGLESSLAGARAALESEQQQRQDLQQRVEA